MPADARDLLERRYVDGQDCATVSRELRMGIDAVYQRLSRMQRALRNCISKRLEPRGTPESA